MVRTLRCAAAAALACTLSAGAAHAEARRSRTVEVFEATKNSVVNISSQRVVQRSPFRLGGPLGDHFGSFFERFMAPPVDVPVHSLGTGFVVGDDGAVLTNYHVVAQAEAIEIKLASGDTFAAELVGAAPDVDLALLMVATEGEAFPAPLSFFTGTPFVGETVIAIGNPYGLDHSVTVGVVSALDRSLNTNDRTYAGVLQTDASINPGNSGGPLINVEGQVVGVATAIYQNAQGIGFAIPSDVALRVLDELRSSGKLSRGWLGVVVQDLTRSLAQSLGLRSTDGVLVSQVEPGSPAAAAGLQAGDLLGAVDNHRLRDVRDLLAHVGTYGPDQRLSLSGTRDGDERSWTVSAGRYDPTRINDWFARVGLVTADARGAFVVTRVRPGSAAAEIGFQPNDAILAIDRIAVGDAPRLQEHLLRNRHKSYFLFHVRRGRWQQRVGLQLPAPDPTL